MGTGLQSAGDVMRGGFGGSWKSQKWSWVLPSEEERWLSLARRGLVKGTNEMGGRWKSQNRKNEYFSPYVKEPLNSKVIKSFVPELRSRKCFSCFEIPMFYVYIWTLYVHFAYLYHGYGTLIYLVPELGMSFMAWLRLGSQVCPHDQRNC